MQGIRAHIRIPILASSLFIVACASQQTRTVQSEGVNSPSRALKTVFLPRSESEAKIASPEYLSQTQADYYYSIGEAYSFDGNSEKAVESFKSVLAIEPESTPVRLRLVTELLRSNQFSEAMMHASLAVKSDPNNTQARVLLGGLFSSMRLFRKAIDQYAAVLEIDPDNQEAPIYLGAVYGELKEYDKSIGYFESVLKLPEYTTPHLPYYYMGRVHLEQGGESHFKKAESLLKKSISIKPEFAESTISLAALYEKWGKEKQILPALEKFQRDHGPSVKVAEILSQQYIDMQKFDEAYEQLEYIEAQSDDSITIKMRMALILLEKKIYQEAAKKLEEVLELAPESDKVRYYLGAVYEELNQPDKAVENFKRVPPASSFYGDAIIHAVLLEKRSGNIKEAIELVQRSIDAKDDNVSFHTLFISLLDEDKQFAQANRAAEQALKKFPENAQVHFFGGVVADRLGDRDRMVSSMRRVVELDPNHVQALNYLAFTWADARQNLAEAEKMSRRAVELEPTDGFIIDTLGWIYFQQGKYKEAMKYLEVAYKYQPEVAIIAEHLGDTYVKHALMEKASSMYMKAIQLESDKEKIEALQQKLSWLRNQFPIPPRMPASQAVKAEVER